MESENTGPGDYYIHLVKDYLSGVEDVSIMEDLDLLCKYIVVKFLKEYARNNHGNSLVDAEKELEKFIKDRYEIMITFMTVMSSHGE